MLIKGAQRFSDASPEEIQAKLDAMSEEELAAAIAEGESRDNQTMLYPLKDKATQSFVSLPNYPYWTETYAVEHRGTYEFLGHVGRLGGSHTWEYDTGLPGEGQKGRARGRENAAMALAKAMNVTGQ